MVVVFSWSRSVTWGLHAPTGEWRRAASSRGETESGVRFQDGRLIGHGTKRFRPKGSVFWSVFFPLRHFSSGWLFEKVKARGLCLVHGGFAGSLGSTVCFEPSEEAKVTGRGGRRTLTVPGADEHFRTRSEPESTGWFCRGHFHPWWVLWNLVTWWLRLSRDREEGGVSESQAAQGSSQQVVLAS